MASSGAASSSRREPSGEVGNSTLSTTPRATAVATTASIAFPPSCNIRKPACVASGCAEATAPCDSTHLFKRADEALYAAKAAGRDAVRNDILDARHG